jgi:hypothetical protein
VHLSARLGVGGQGHTVATFGWEGPSAHCTGSWLDLRAGLDKNVKSHLNRGSNCGMSRCSKSLHQLHYPGHQGKFTACHGGRYIFTHFTYKQEKLSG